MLIRVSLSQVATGQVAKPPFPTPKVISPETRVMSPEILIKSVCNISRSVSDNEAKKLG